MNLYGCSAKFIKVSMMPVFCITLASVPVFSSNGLLTVGICGLIGLTVAAVFIHLLAIRLFRRTLDLADVIDVDRNTVRRAQFEHTSCVGFRLFAACMTGVLLLAANTCSHSYDRCFYTLVFAVAVYKNSLSALDVVDKVAAVTPLASTTFNVNYAVFARLAMIVLLAIFGNTVIVG